MFGIDYTELGGIKLKSIEDINALIKNKNVIISMSHGEIYLIGDKRGNYIKCTNIQISDEKITKLNIGIKVEKDFCKEYVLLNMSIDGKGNNLLPLSYNDYLNKVYDTINYIYNTYGIELDIENISFKTLEINKTFILNNEWSVYEEILQVFAYLKPKRYKETKMFLDENLKQITIENKSIAIKVYNKKRQLKQIKKWDSINPLTFEKIEGFTKGMNVEDKGIMRIEIVLKTHKKIQQSLGDNKLNNIKQEDLEKFFDKEIMKSLVLNFDSYIEESNKKLRQIAKEEREKDIKKWVKAFFLESLGEKIDNNKNLDLVFDIEQLLNIIKEHTKSNYSRSKKNIEYYINKHENKKNNLKNMDEIINKTINNKSIISYRK